MQKSVKFYLGMDVSKLWIDIVVMCVEDHQKQPAISGHFDNDATGIKALHKWLKKHNVSFDENSLLVIENTGVYHRLIWEYCSLYIPVKVSHHSGQSEPPW